MKTKKLLGILLALVMVVCLSTVAFAADTAIDLSQGAYTITEAGEYVVQGNINTTNTLTINAEGNVTVTLNGVTINALADCSAISIEKGNVTLISTGKTNNLYGGDNGTGIYVAADASLTIKGDEMLNAVGNNGVDDASGAAGIGGAYGKGASGKITIDGATVTALGYGVWASGIGSAGGYADDITIINGADVYAEGGYYANGKGTELQSSYGKSDPEGGAAIGGGSKDGAGVGTITITGSAVEAYGGSKAAGIGAMFWNSVEAINISGNSNVTAQGGSSSAGIGTSRAGDAGVSANITISGGTVTATGGDYGSGIGGGYNADSLSELPKISVTISNAAEVEATGGMGGAAIGGGYKTNNLEIAISDTANVTAVAGEMVEGKTAASGGVPCAIGSGANGSGTFVGSYITIAETATVTVETVRGDKAAIETVTTTGGTNSIPTSVTLKEEIVGLFGSGTEADPYLINDLAELKWFRDTVNTYQSDGSNQYKGKYVKLTADIDLAGENWTPIGTNSVGDHMAFLGTFDGAGHTISNLYVNSDGDHLGFFARVGSYVEGIAPTVKNINFKNVDVSSNTTTGHGGSYVGGVIANAGGNSVVSNVKVTGDVYVTGYGYVGGIVGHGYPDIDNCHVTANDGSYLNCYYWCAGGIIGYAGEGGTPITNCSVSGLDIWSAYGGAAAVAGLLQDGNTMTNVTASNVNVSSNSDYCMGYVAGNGEESTLTDITVINVTVTANGKPANTIDGNGIIAYYAVTFNVPTGAEIVVKDSDGADCALTDGNWLLPNGTYTYTVSKPGYYTEEGTITVAGEAQTVTVSLAKLPTLYTINKAQCENGSVTAQAVMAAKGSTIKVSAVPAEGYKVWTLTVTDAAGNEIEIVDGKITMPASNITVSATFVYDLPFEDVADDAENYAAIAYMYENGLMVGTSTEQYIFDGDVKMTRSQIAQILYRLAGEPTVEYSGAFTDVAEGKWYTAAVEWAASKGIMVGVGDGTFAHNRQIKVVEMSALIYRYAQCQLTGECTSSDWATESAAAMTWCVENGVLAEGTDGTAIADRDLAAEMFYNVYNLLNK